MPASFKSGFKMNSTCGTSREEDMLHVILQLNIQQHSYRASNHWNNKMLGYIPINQRLLFSDFVITIRLKLLVLLFGHIPAHISKETCIFALDFL